MFFKARFELSPYGEEFKNSYAIVRLLSSSESISYNKRVSKAAQKVVNVENDIDTGLDNSVKLMEIVLNNIKNQFLAGEIFDESVGKERAITKEDFDSFPTNILSDLGKVIESGVSKKG